MLFASIWARALGLIFLLIAGVMLTIPDQNLASDGVDFNSFTIAGQAEVRAYYFGTALSLSWVMLTCELRVALKAIQLVLGGFASSRVYTYYKDGVDADPSFRMHQHCVFAAEVGGCSLATFLLMSGAAGKAKTN